MNTSDVAYDQPIVNQTAEPTVMNRHRKKPQGVRTRVFHMQKHTDMYTNSIRLEYDPWIGIQTASILGSCLFLVTAYILYKAKCKRQTWHDNDELYMKVYRRKMEQLTGKKFPPPNLAPLAKEKNGVAVGVRRDSILKPPLGNMEQTAKWIQSQPLNSALPEGMENVANLHRICPTCSMRDIRTISRTPLLSRKKDKNFCVCHGKNTHLCTVHCMGLEDDFISIHSPKEFLASMAIETTRLPKETLLCKDSITLAIPSVDAVKYNDSGSSQSLPNSFLDQEKNTNIDPTLRTQNIAKAYSNNIIHITPLRTAPTNQSAPIVLSNSPLVQRPTKLFPETLTNAIPQLPKAMDSDCFLESTKLVLHPDSDLCASNYDPLDFNDCHSIVNRQREKDKHSFTTEASIELNVLKNVDPADVNLSSSLEGACGLDTSFKAKPDDGSFDYDPGATDQHQSHI